jgi:hypothetical protein
MCFSAFSPQKGALTSSKRCVKMRASWRFSAFSPQKGALTFLLGVFAQPVLAFQCLFPSERGSDFRVLKLAGSFAYVSVPFPLRKGL